MTTLQPRDIFAERASLYALENEVWKKIGTGELTLTYNPYHPKELILKIMGDNSTDVFVYQIKPKVKSKGPMSWVLKGLNTKTKEEHILAARFAETYASEEFQKAVDGAIRNSRAHLKELAVTSNEDTKSTSQKPWTCELCTSENGKDDRCCGICLSPRPTDRGEDSDSHSIRESATLPPLSPRVSIGSNNGFKGFGEGHSAQEEEFIYGSVQSPNKEAFEFDSSGLKEQPTAEDPIHSTKNDFIRILNIIDSGLDDQTAGIKLFEDLRKVAKRLLRPDNKYRVLDLRNPVVRTRLLGVDGVDAYLKYLGFEEHKDKQKMVCPPNQPAKSIIKAAMEVCEEFKQRAIEYKETVEGMRRQSATSAPKEQATTNTTENNNASTTTDKDNTTQNGATENGTNKEKEEKDGNQEKIERDRDEYTIRQMIFQITNPESRDDKTQDVLLLCHKSYCNSSDLLRTMIERFQEAGEDWQTKLKVGNMLRQWIRNFYAEDFEAENGCLEILENFLAEMAKGDAKVKKLGTTISKSLEQQGEEFELKAQTKKKNLLTQMSIKFKFAEADPRMIAEQISLMDFKLFSAIQKRECLGQAWKKKDRDKRAPNVMAMIDQFNKVTKWIQVLILAPATIRERTKVLKKCIQIAGHLLEMRNFSSCCAVKTALMSNAIYRLKACWSTIPKKHEEAFNEIQQIFDAAHNWSELRKLHRHAPTPAILHIGVLLQDIVFIDEGNVERKDGVINFSRLMRLYEKIEMLAMYQHESYAFKGDAIIQQVLERDFSDQEKFDDDYFWKLSTEVKEKDNKASGWKE